MYGTVGVWHLSASAASYLTSGIWSEAELSDPYITFTTKRAASIPTLFVPMCASTGA